jgi:MoxR-vWA-beta-propeller ternary system domain bpX4
MLEFLRALRENGEVVVTAETPAPLDGEFVSAIEEHERERRLGYRTGAPDLDLDAAYWGIRTLYQACQLVVLRDAPSEVALASLTAGFEGRKRQETHYSTDLGLSYLPSLHRLAERVAPGDPLLEGLKRLGRDWPLSSVGMPGIDVPPDPPFVSVPFLRALYVDRILEADDATRLGDGSVARSIRGALGAYPEMCPRIHERLAETGSVGGL